MLITDHWSASGPNRINDYHVEFGAKAAIDPTYNKTIGSYANAASMDFAKLYSLFNVWKNVDLSTPTDYGTYMINNDPRDNSANIEVGALCMGGENVSTVGPWGQYPYTFAHAWMHAAINARICKLKGISPTGSFVSSNFMNGPVYNISTHAERAIQTPDGPAANLRPNFGYFIFSGDPDCRWDIAVRDVSLAPKLATPDNAKIEAIASATWIRQMTAEVLATLDAKSDMWGLDKEI
jgi:hypothetical protein